MPYDYNNGDGVSVLLVTEPNGATEPVSNADNAIRQIKKYLNDPSVGPDGKITALQSNVGVIATAGAIQNFVAGAGPSVINFNVVDNDPGNDYNESTKVFVAPEDGRYLVIIAVTVDQTASAAPTDIQHQLDILVNGISGARKRVRTGADDSERTIDIVREFNLSAGQALTWNYTLTVGSGTLTMTLMNDPRESIVQVELLKRGN